MKKRQTILIVDDVEMNRAILQETFRDEYETLEAENGLEAMQMIERHRDDLAAILLDVIMPVMGGFEVLMRMHEKGLTELIPVFLITAESSQNILKQGYDLGVVDIIGKPIVPFFIKRRIENVIQLNQIVNRQEAVLREQAEKIQELNGSVIETLATAIEFRDCESGEHVQRIRDLTLLFLKKLSRLHPECGVPKQEITLIAEAAVMHDIGKIAIPDNVLNKPGRLTQDEFEIMKTHSVKGCELLDSIPKLKENPIYEYAYDICRHHHERWDGRGYPDGLKGNDISLWAQIVSVADVYDALVNERVYKRAYPHDVAVQMIINGECGQFNPVLMDMMLHIQDEIRELYE